MPSAARRRLRWRAARLALSGPAYAVGSTTCLGLPSVHEDPEFTITWNNGQHSVLDLTFTDTIAGGIEQITGTGPVVSGQSEGGNATVI
jgi:hypothetical protein